MAQPTPLNYADVQTHAIADHVGRVAVFVDEEGHMDLCARKVNTLTKGAIARLIASDKFSEMKQGQIFTLPLPAGMKADAVDIVHLSRRASQENARKAGASLAKLRGDNDVLLALGNRKHAAQFCLGLALRDYAFVTYKPKTDPAKGAVNVMCSDPQELEAQMHPLLAMADGIFMTRDLTNEPANVLTTSAFADRLAEMQSLGLEVEVLDEEALGKLGMGCLLAVGQGSASPSKVVVMQWNGGEKDQAPLALVGKGVVFDTGGISLKPAAGMEDMTMDMGGAGVVAGTMRALALRKAKANVVGLVGLVENMPSSMATRPGDIVNSMKGDTVEVINTDAEGRMVLCDVMWYTQERFKPAAMIDLATLTGAVIVGLGHENAGVFSNDDTFCNAFLKAAADEGEGAWRLPLSAGYDKLIDSKIADVKNSGGRVAGSITAAQFLHRFVKEDCPWMHLDIAGVASVKSATTFAPAGATGWGVLSLNRLIADMFEAK